MKKTIILFVITCLSVGSIFAGGFQVSLHSAENVGMGLVGTSLSSSPSCIFYNPGALSFVPGIVNVSFGANFLMATTKFHGLDTSTYATQNKFGINYPFYFYASVNFLKRFSFGIGAYTPYGSATTWDDNWRGRYIIQKASLTAIYIQPTVSVKFWKIGIGAGLVYAIGILEQDIALSMKLVNKPDGQLIVKGQDYKGLGFNVGILVQPIKRLSIGINYRSEVKLKFKEGDATFNNIPTMFASQFPAGNKISTEIPLPANLNFGVHFMITDNWLLGIQADYTFWNVYDTTYIDFKTNTGILTDQKVANLYKNSWAFRLGSEYKYKMFAFRVGGYFDFTPIPKEQVHPQDPGNSHYGLSAGLSIKPIKFLSIDIAYLYIHALQRETNFSPLGIPASSYPGGFKGTYVTNGHSPSIGISIHI